MNEDLACRVVGQMDNTTDHTFESANRVYDKDGLCPTIPTGTGGGHLPKILTRKEIKGSCGEIWQESNFWERCLDTKGRTARRRLATRSMTLTESRPPFFLTGGGYGIMIVDKKERGGQTPIFTERRGTLYRIRKLTPRECGRLMGVDDSDIDKMETVNSNSQLYRQFGDSIVVDVMCAMFRNLNIKGVRKDG